MYEYFKGTLIEATPLHVVVDVQGVGYYLSVPVCDFGQLPSIGEPVFLYACFLVREMSHTLYGFLIKELRDLFKELITVNGVGPKTALGIIGHLSLEEMHEALKAQDYTRFSKVPGIGKKTAERLLIELQGRFKTYASPHTTQPTGQLKDALHALMQLGYTQAAAETALQRAVGRLPEGYDLSALVTAALKYR